MKRSRGQRKTQDPCEVCRMHRTRCFCELIPRLTTRAKLSLIIHFKEIRRTTNTGLLATRALSNSEVFIRGQSVVPLDLRALLDQNFRPVLFYPSDAAVELTKEFVEADARPIHLIVPDGNWRQASKVQSRYPELRNIPRVMITSAPPENHVLRAESTSHGMATLQAIAFAFGVIESELSMLALLELYKIKLTRTLQGRGVRQLS